MKPIQIMLDEQLLAELDASDEVKAEGRSAVLRRATAEYLAKRRRERVTMRYRLAYSNGDGLGEEFADWTEQGTWPSE